VPRKWHKWWFRRRKDVEENGTEDRNDTEEELHCDSVHINIGSDKYAGVSRHRTPSAFTHYQKETISASKLFCSRALSTKH